MTTSHPDHASNPTPPQRPSPDWQPRSATAGVVDWVGWHLPELLGVGVPLLGVWLISPWCALVSAVVAAWWALHELRATTATVPSAADTGERPREGREQSP